MKKKNVLPAAVALAAASLLFPGIIRADEVYVGVGGGIQHTKDWALQLTAPMPRDLELHYSYWDDGRRVGAIGLGYRFQIFPTVSFVFGGAYINRVTQNLLRHTNAYLEVRWRPLDPVSCQFGHYSSIGDDTGENMLLCGVHWQLAR